MTERIKQVLIRPLWDMGLNNRLFNTIYPWTMTRWREAADALGVALDTWDTMPLERADCVWLLDLPEKKSTFEDARRRGRPGVPFVLQVMESPVGRMHNFEPANQALCDYVVTYQPNVDAKPNYFTYRLPHSLVYDGALVPFERRRCAIMVNTNRVQGYGALRQSGLVGLPGIGRNLSGWKLPLSTLFQPARGELYSWRRQLARTAESIDPQLVAIFGPGWNGERISWNPFLSRRPYRCNEGTHTTEKLRLAAGYRFCISVENYQGTLGYVSEKLFDAFLAGAVPVYLGDENITQLVPPKAFVDVRNFRNHRELLLYLHSCPRDEWEEMHTAGQAFIKSEAARSFSTSTYVETMNAILLRVLGMTPGIAAHAAGTECHCASGLIIPDKSRIP